MLGHGRLPSICVVSRLENGQQRRPVSRDTFTPWNAGRSPSQRVAEVLSVRAWTRGSRSSRRERRPRAPRPRPSAPLGRRSSSRSLFICDGRPTLALVPGDRRADETKVAAAAGAAARARRPARRGRWPRPDSSPEASRPSRLPGVSQVLICRRASRPRTRLDRSRLRAATWPGISPLDLVRLTQARAADLT